MAEGLRRLASGSQVTRVQVVAEPVGTTDGSTRDDRASVRMGGGLFRVVVLDRGTSRAHVALVPTTALLLAGDHVRIEVEVGPGCLLEITEPAGTVAYGMDGGAAIWDVAVRVGPGGGLIWHTPEFVVSAGARVERRTNVSLAGDARCLLRETLVLGRAGESPGHLLARTHVTRDGVPLLVEQLVADPSAQVPGLLGHHRVVDQVLDLRRSAAGADAYAGAAGAHAAATGATGSAAAGTGPLRLWAGGALHRRLAPAAHEGSLDATWTALVGEHRPVA